MRPLISNPCVALLYPLKSWTYEKEGIGHRLARGDGLEGGGGGGGGGGVQLSYYVQTWWKFKPDFLICII